MRKNLDANWRLRLEQKARICQKKKNSSTLLNANIAHEIIHHQDFTIVMNSA
jgi:hypothetical protein